MCNCNQKRTAYAADNSQNSKTNEAHRGMNQVKLVQQQQLEINGDITGRTYLFKNRNDIVWVDKRDLANMKQIKGLQIFG